MKLYNHLNEFEIYLENYFDNLSNGNEDVLFESVAYGIVKGGKRLRPMLAFASAEAVGGDYKKLFSIALAIEMIHSYSLIHDDLPCMDNDDMRHGKLSCHKKFGYPQALLAGDALLNTAFELLSENRENIASDVMLKVINVIAKKAGVSGMILGQSYDISGNVDNMDTVHDLKTAKLFQAALLSGAIVSGADVEAQKSLNEFGRLSGLAFQITDDILDVTGDVSALGKNINQDYNKTTYVTLYGIEGARQKAFEVIELAKNTVKGLTYPNTLCEFADFIISRNR